MEDLMNLTDQDLNDWRVRYHKSSKDHDLTRESLEDIIPLSPEAYSRKYDKEESNELSAKERADLDRMKTAAGVKVTTKAPKNEFTDSLRIAAGIK